MVPESTGSITDGKFKERLNEIGFSASETGRLGVRGVVCAGH
jgi:hypothetical protein